MTGLPALSTEPPHAPNPPATRQAAPTRAVRPDVAARVHRDGRARRRHARSDAARAGAGGGFAAGTVLYLMLRRPEELAVDANHVSWAHMYRMMFVAQIGFALAYVL